MMLTFLLTSLLSICILCHIQFFGWMVAANTLLEYLLAASTVAKGFASYFTVLIGELARPMSGWRCLLLMKCACMASNSAT
jgi:hypothetical protein